MDQASRPAAWAAALSSLSCGAAVLAGLLVGADAVRAGDLDRVWLAVVVLVPLALTDVVAGLPGAAQVLVRGGLAAQRLEPLLQAPPEHGPLPVDAAAPAPDGTLTAEGLRCGWPGRPALAGRFEVVVRPGELVAVVGPCC
jgi:ABC-type transport system involved in cytochrome bd biosynthesis fused ATPase/permease subunit